MSFFTLEIEIPIVRQVSARKCRERIGVIAITVISPTAGRLELGRRRILVIIFRNGVVNGNNQSLPLKIAGKMPTLGAHSAHRFFRRTWFVIATTFAICTPCPRTIHGGAPHVKTTVLGAVCITIIETVSVFSFVVQVLRHPYLVTDLDGLVGLAIAKVFQSVIYRIKFAAILLIPRRQGFTTG